MGIVKLSHVSKKASAQMVDVTPKAESHRVAGAEAIVVLGRNTVAVLKGKRGQCVVETARIAGIMAAKKTSELIPMCHPLAISSVGISAEWLSGSKLKLVSAVSCFDRTGVEMEALTAVTVAALTVYDMCKSADKGIVIERIRLLEKSGGKSGHWKAGSSCKTEQHKDDKVTAAMNRVLEEIGPKVDDFTRRAARPTRRRVEW